MDGKLGNLSNKQIAVWADDSTTDEKKMVSNTREEITWLATNDDGSYYI